MPNAEQLLYQTEKNAFYKNAVLKNFAIFTGKHLHEILKNTYFEEHLGTAAFELTLCSHCLELLDYKNTSCFWCICRLYIKTAHFLVNLGFVCSSLTVTTQNANACSAWAPS